MTLSENAMSLSEAAEEFGPDPDEDDMVVNLIRWDEMTDPLEDDLVSVVAGWRDHDSVSLWRAGPDISYYYVDEAGDVWTVDELAEGEPDWFEAPDPLPDWYEAGL